MPTTSPIARRLATTALLAAGGLAVSIPAQAQLGGGPMSSMIGARRTEPPAAQAPAVPPVPALPGSHAAAPAAPPIRLPLDMAPTEALFDAINRGDLAAARDALARGADLNGKSVLGQTPLELSVDLGRNGITFLLLSMRRIGGSERVQQAAAAAEPPPSRRRHHERLRDAEFDAMPPAAAPMAASSGTPVPAAGFLGFDFGRQAVR